MSEHTEMTPERLAVAREIAEAAEQDPLLYSDCEGSLRVWRESALLNVVRDGDGEISGWREPFSYRPSDLVVEHELDSWDEGEEPEDDRLRQTVGHMVAAYALTPALLAEVERLRAQVAELERAALDDETQRHASAYLYLRDIIEAAIAGADGPWDDDVAEEVIFGRFVDHLAARPPQRDTTRADVLRDAAALVRSFAPPRPEGEEQEAVAYALELAALAVERGRR